MAKSNPLSEGLNRKAASPVAEPETVEPARVTKKPATRAGRKMVAYFLPLDAARTLRMIALEQGTTLQDLLTDATDMIFHKYGKPQIAQRRD